MANLIDLVNSGSVLVPPFLEALGLTKTKVLTKLTFQGLQISHIARGLKLEHWEDQVMASGHRIGL